MDYTKINEQKRIWRSKNKEKLNLKWKEYYHKNRSILPCFLKKCRTTGDGILGTSGMGREYELLVLSYLNGATDCNSIDFRSPWDIEWNGFKIDVKARNLDKQGNFHFSSRRVNNKVDYYLCFCLENGEIWKTFLVPGKDFGKNMNFRKIIAPSKIKYLVKFPENFVALKERSFTS